jgi:hypothetical protein
MTALASVLPQHIGESAPLCFMAAWVFPAWFSAARDQFQSLSASVANSIERSARKRLILVLDELRSLSFVQAAGWLRFSSRLLILIARIHRACRGRLARPLETDRRMGRRSGRNGHLRDHISLYPLGQAFLALFFGRRSGPCTSARIWRCRKPRCRRISFWRPVRWRVRATGPVLRVIRNWSGRM